MYINTSALEIPIPFEFVTDPVTPNAGTGSSDTFKGSIIPLVKFTETVSGAYIDLENTTLYVPDDAVPVA